MTFVVVRCLMVVVCCGSFGVVGCLSLVVEWALCVVCCCLMCVYSLFDVRCWLLSVA